MKIWVRKSCRPFKITDFYFVFGLKTKRLSRELHVFTDRYDSRSNTAKPKPDLCIVIHRYDLGFDFSNIEAQRIAHDLR